MKKSVLLILLLVSIVVAQDYVPEFQKSTPRYTDFPLDNIHILRLQEASTSLGGNVSELKTELNNFEERQTRELSILKGSMDTFQKTIFNKLSDIERQIDRLSTNLDRPQVTFPSEVNFPPYMVILLGVNVFLLVLIVILIFWLREQYYVHKVEHKEEHIHPAPKELKDYITHALEHKRKLKDIRLELAQKGWTPSIIEHAISAAKEK